MTPKNSEVDRSYELEARGEDRVPARPGDGHDTILERLAQRLEHRARELRQLVEKENAAVCE